MSYKQMGVVANVELNEEEAAGSTVAWQRFLPTGPVALLPLTDNLSSLVWTTNYDHAKQLLRMSPEEFVDALNHAFVSYSIVNFNVITNILGSLLVENIQTRQTGRRCNEILGKFVWARTANRKTVAP